jgi:hypothetical protein
MKYPIRHENHSLEEKSITFFRQHLPEEHLQLLLLLLRILPANHLLPTNLIPYSFA